MRLEEEYIGTIQVMSTGLSRSSENLHFLTNRIVVEKTVPGGAIFVSPLAAALIAYKKDKELNKMSIDDILKNGKNYTIPHADIRKVKLKKQLRAIILEIETINKKNGWFAVSFPKKEGSIIGESTNRLEDYESFLKPIFGEKLVH